jgi:hypothetical protein
MRAILLLRHSDAYLEGSLLHVTDSLRGLLLRGEAFFKVLRSQLLHVLLVILPHGDKLQLQSMDFRLLLLATFLRMVWDLSTGADSEKEHTEKRRNRQH